MLLTGFSEQKGKKWIGIAAFKQKIAFDLKVCPAKVEERKWTTRKRKRGTLMQIFGTENEQNVSNLKYLLH